MIRKIVAVMVTGVFVLVSGAVSFAMSCGEHATEEVTAETAITEPVDAGNTICPVSGAKIGEGGMEPVSYEYEGKIYNFCCAMCIDEFKKDPDKYIGKVEEELGRGIIEEKEMGREE